MAPKSFNSIGLAPQAVKSTPQGQECKTAPLARNASHHGFAVRHSQQVKISSPPSRNSLTSSNKPSQHELSWSPPSRHSLPSSNSVVRSCSQPALSPSPPSRHSLASPNRPSQQGLSWSPPSRNNLTSSNKIARSCSQTCLSSSRSSLASSNSPSKTVVIPVESDVPSHGIVNRAADGVRALTSSNTVARSRSQTCLSSSRSSLVSSNSPSKTVVIPVESDVTSHGIVNRAANGVRAAAGVIAIDIDEVLFDLTGGFRNFLQDHFPHTPLPSDVEMQCISGDASSPLWKAFVQSSEFRDLPVVAGAADSLQRLHAAGHRIEAVTSRATSLKQVTQSSIDKKFPGVISKIHYTSGQRKGCLCRSIGAWVLIDDSIANVLGVAEKGLLAVLFGKFPWNQGESLPPNVVHVHHWADTVEWIMKNRPSRLKNGHACAAQATVSGSGVMKEATARVTDAHVNHPFKVYPGVSYKEAFWSSWASPFSPGSSSLSVGTACASSDRYCDFLISSSLEESCAARVGCSSSVIPQMAECTPPVATMTLYSGIQDKDKVDPQMAEHTPATSAEHTPVMSSRISTKDRPTVTSNMAGEALPLEFEVYELDRSDESKHEHEDAFLNKCQRGDCKNGIGNGLIFSNQKALPDAFIATPALLAWDNLSKEDPIDKMEVKVDRWTAECAKFKDEVTTLQEETRSIRSRTTTIECID